MDSNEYERLRAAFLKTFASVPTPLRDQIIVVVNGKPYNWESAFMEVKEGTKISKKILEELKNLKILNF